MTQYMGLDVHCKQTTYVIQSAGGEVVAQGECDTTPEALAAVVRDHGLGRGARVGLETGSQAFWVSGVLSALDLEAQVIDAGEVRAKARRRGQKTDRRDAFEICDGVRRDIFTKIVWTPPAPIRRLRAILSRRRHFVSACTREVNAAKYLLRAHGVPYGRLNLVSRVAWRRLLDRTGDVTLREMLKMHARVWRMMRATVKTCERELTEALEPFADLLDWLTSAPGVGLITAATFIAVVGTPERFASSAHVASYIGLAPSMYDSGETERHGRITRQGSGELRSVLCEAAHHAARPTHPLHPYFARACARGGFKKAVVAVAHRLARILFQLWRRRERFDVARLNVERCTRRVEKTVHWQLCPAT